MQAAIVDTRHFQRLRYIRQNGLLHFIFPGAVHTRFAHSLGTLELARRAFRHLVGAWGSASASADVEYVETAFQLAALLHDVGHCAFSHAIEHVCIRARPIFGTAAEFLTALASIHRASLLGELEDRSYTKALIDRRLPVHLGALSLVGVSRAEQSAKIAEHQSGLAAAHRLRREELWHAQAQSHLIKPGELFLWSFRQRGKPETVCHSFEFSSLRSALEHHLVHFFVDRDAFHRSRSVRSAAD